MNVRVVAEIIFWLSAGALFYTYVGYPLLISVVSTLRPRSVRRGNYAPLVTMIVTAYNEQPRSRPASPVQRAGTCEFST